MNVSLPPWASSDIPRHRHRTNCPSATKTADDERIIAAHRVAGSLPASPPPETQHRITAEVESTRLRHVLSVSTGVAANKKVDLVEFPLKLNMSLPPLAPGHIGARIAIEREKTIATQKSPLKLKVSLPAPWSEMSPPASP
jgi:hypothetical protein